MRLFDSNCMLGRRSVHTPLDVPVTASELLAEMDRLGIAEALVYHAMALDGFPPEGNERLMRETESHPRLHAAWVLLPDSGEMATPSILVQEMKRRGVRAARFCPFRHRYRIDEPTLGSMLASLEEARIPAFLDYGVAHWSSELTDWRELFKLCRRYPRLPFVVVGEGMGAPRRLFPSWKEYPNLYLETSYYQVNQGLSDIANRFGAERLLFGTGQPYRAPGPPLTQLLFDFLSEESRARVAGDNLRGLLGLPMAGTSGKLETGEAALLTSYPVIDAHAHLGGWFSTYIHSGDAAGMVRNMDRLNIESTAIIAFDAIAADYRGGNDRVAEAMRAFPGRFLGYATVDPNDSRGMSAELERCFGKLGFHAIKFHCETHGCPADDDRYRPALEYANAHGNAVLIHGRITEAMLRDYPNAQFLSAHVGGWDGRSPQNAMELCRDYPNIHCELCCSTVFNGAIERMAEQVGADRIVHGSDTPLMDAGYQLGRVLAAKLTEDEKRRILRDNACRLFGLAPNV